jgi:hypothetical protein
MDLAFRAHGRMQAGRPLSEGGHVQLFDIHPALVSAEAIHEVLILELVGPLL